jgi:hypothetical protein
MSISSAGNVGIYAPISGSPVQLTRITSAVGMARLDQEIKAVYWQWGSYAVDSMLEELRVAHGNS